MTRRQGGRASRQARLVRVQKATTNCWKSRQRHTPCAVLPAASSTAPRPPGHRQELVFVLVLQGSHAAQVPAQLHGPVLRRGHCGRAGGGAGSGRQRPAGQGGCRHLLPAGAASRQRGIPACRPAAHECRQQAGLAPPVRLQPAAFAPRCARGRTLVLAPPISKRCSTPRSVPAARRLEPWDHESAVTAPSWEPSRGSTAMTLPLE